MSCTTALGTTRVAQAPNAWRIRATISNSIDGATVAPRVASPMRTKPLRITGRRPILSDRGPMKSCAVAKVSRNSDTVSCTDV